MPRAPSTPFPPVTARGDYVGGRFRRAARRAGTIAGGNPGDLRDAVGRFPRGGGAAVAVAVDAARRAQPAWAAVPQIRRVAAIERLVGPLRARAEDLARAITRETGKPLWSAREEVRRLEGRIRVTLDESLPALEAQAVVERRGRVRHRPLGVIGILGPFNFPANLVHGQVVPALVTGNAVVVKPSEHAPAVGQLYAEIVDAAGLPPGVFNLVQGGPAEGAALAAHPDTDAVLFTGSWSSGQAVEMEARARPGKLVALEMGGQNAAIVMADADAELAAREIVGAAFATSGQRCSATRRAILHRRIAGRVIARIVALTRAVRVGYGFDDDVFMGPLISAEALARVRATLAGARRAGLVEALEPDRTPDVGRPGHYLRPSVHRIRRRDPRAAYFADELFGPDLAIEVVDDLDHALAAANDSAWGLCLSVFSRSRRPFEEALRRGRAGVINWNRGTIGGSAHMPFGGLGRSGNHRPGGADMIRACVFPVASQEGPPGAPTPPGFPHS